MVGETRTRTPKNALLKRAGLPGSPTTTKNVQGETRTRTLANRLLKPAGLPNSPTWTHEQGETRTHMPKHRFLKPTGLPFPHLLELTEKRRIERPNLLRLLVFQTSPLRQRADLLQTKGRGRNRTSGVGYGVYSAARPTNSHHSPVNGLPNDAQKGIRTPKPGRLRPRGIPVPVTCAKNPHKYPRLDSNQQPPIFKVGGSAIGLLGRSDVTEHRARNAEDPRALGLGGLRVERLSPAPTRRPRGC